MKQRAMDGEETVLIVGNDISLSDLQAEMEVGEDGGKEGQDWEEEGQDALSALEEEEEKDLSSFELLEMRNVFCFLDENLLDSSPHVLPDKSQGSIEDSMESPSAGHPVSAASDICVASANCPHRSLSPQLHSKSQDIKECDVKSPELFHGSKALSPSDNGFNQRGDPKTDKNNVGINCDTNSLRLETEDKLLLHEQCKDSPAFPNGVRQDGQWAQPSERQGGRWAQPSEKQGGRWAQLSDKEGRRLTQPSDNPEQHEHSSLTRPSQSNKEDALESETSGQLPFEEPSIIKLNGASAASSTASAAAPQNPVIHTTVIDVHPGHIVHKHDKNVLECDILEHYSALQSLPEEMMLKIFSYFSPKELCQYVAPVCRHWHVLAYEPTLWTCLEIDPLWEVSVEDITALLERVSGVRNLSLHARNDVTYLEIFNYVKHCDHLTELDLGLCDSINIDVIHYIVKFCPLLNSINVEGCSKIDVDCVKLLASLRHLSHLNLSHCRLENDSILLLTYSIDSIISFNVDGVSWITDDGVVPLCERHKSSLKHLELDGEELTDRSMSAVAKCKSLVTLNVSFCDLLTDASLEYLKELTKLRKLRLRKGLEFSEEAVEKFFKHGHLHNVTDLDMSECAGMKDISLLSLTACCGSSLIVLALQWCWYITDIGLASIVECCSNLERLDLTGLHYLSGECLERVPDDMVHLRFLDLRNCNNMNDKLICEMIRLKPDLQVVNFYGEMFVHG